MRSRMINRRRITRGLLLGILCLVVMPTTAAARAALTLAPTTLRDCTDSTKNHADPINVAFVGPRATWQNTQRLVGYDRSGPHLMWRTTSGAAGGQQHIVDFSDNLCPRQNGQSSVHFWHKHHTRYFQQFDPFLPSSGSTPPYWLTGLDAHRDVKSRHCKGPGSIDPPLTGQHFNDRVPVKDNGFTDGGYNQAQREFQKAFPDYKAKRKPSPAQGERFVQCPEDDPPNRYVVGWNGWVQYFSLFETVPCQDPWHRGAARVLGSCPSGG